MTKIKRHSLGFTLLEILIALFVFTILALMMSRALHTVIDAQTNTENRAEALRNLQMAILIFSRDVEQTVNRPAMNASGTLQPAFDGAATSFTFTHGGYAMLDNVQSHSTLQRTSYSFHDNGFWRTTWVALDQAPGSTSNSRLLLTNVSEGNFRYLSKDGKLYSKWPVEGANNQALPRAIQINLTITKWGALSILYVIPAQVSQILTGSSASGQQPPQNMPGQPTMGRQFIPTP